MTIKSAETGPSPDADVRLGNILNKEIPFSIRHALLREWVSDDAEPACRALERLLERAAAGHVDEIAKAKQAELEQLIEQLKAGALRPATYVGTFDGPANPTRVRVRTPSGEEMSSLVPDEDLRASLRFGDTAWLDAQGRSVLYRQDASVEAGEVVRFERRRDDRRIVVTVHDHDAEVIQMSDALAERVKKGEVSPGANLLACLKRRIAFESLDEEGGNGNFRYLSRDPLPDVLIERDLGDPPPFIADVLAHIRREITAPAHGRKYRIRRAQTKLLAGVSGSGKTLSIEATIRAAYELLAEHIGVPIEDLPRRVMRLRMAEVGSMWFSQTEKNIDRYFDEVSAMSDLKYTAADGTEHELPVFCIIEEADSIGMARGGEETYSRIQGTLLQRLDANSRRFGERLIIVLATTNLPQLLDSAMLRRLGGTVERFGRLSRNGCAAVLEKHLAGLPLPEAYGSDAAHRERHVIRETLAWLYGMAGDDPDLVEVTYVGSAIPTIFRRRALLTGGLIDRSVQQAAQTACRREFDVADEQGITCDLLIEAFDKQIRAIVEQLTEQNVGHHLTLPHGVRVAHVRALDPPPLSRRDLNRN